jgi:hypothetical protein
VTQPPPIVPDPDPQQPVPPQVIYVQQDPRLAKQHVAQGVGSAAATGLIVVLAVCVGIPLMLFAGWMLLAGIGWLASR